MPLIEHLRFKAACLTGNNMIDQQSTKKNKHQYGYALLVSLVIASVVLTIGISIANLVEKGLVLSSTARDSQFAFYGADSGSECALYWDLKHEGFGQTVFPTSTESSPPTSGVICNNEDIAQTWTIFDVTSNSATTRFDLTFSDDTCVEIDVVKEEDGIKTTVESRGRNTCDLTRPRRLERATRILY